MHHLQKAVYRLSALVLAGWLCLCALLSAGCDGQKGDETTEASLPSSAVAEETSHASTADSTPSADAATNESEEFSYPEATESLVLVYKAYITVHAVKDNIDYTYTYCFNDKNTVFNAQACVTFPTQESAYRVYCKLADSEYPNLTLDGCCVSYAFPRKECPYYGVSFRALQHMLGETVYEIVDLQSPEAEESIG